MATPREELESMFAQDRDGEIMDTGETQEVEDTEDGGAIVKTGDDPDVAADVEFYGNIVDIIDPTERDRLATELIELIDIDIQSREGRDKQYEEGIKRTGIANEAPGGAQFNGASRTVHPMITKAAVDFGARAIKEIFPPGGPAKSEILGDETKERLEKANRKTAHMNWQLVHQIPEFRSSLEKLLTQLPMGGVQYQRWVWVPRKKRPAPNFVPVDKMIIPYSAEDFYSAERRTFIEDISQYEFDKRVRDGLYVADDSLPTPVTPPEPTRAEKASDKVEGKSEPIENRDGERRVYETETELDLSEQDDKSGGEPRPYIVRIDPESRKMIGLVRNWERERDTGESMTWTIEWPFIPWRGGMPIGIAQMIGGLSVAATGSLRALLDSAHINNIPTLLKLKGAGVGGQSLVLDPTVVQDVEGTPGIDDIRKLVMAVPFNEPSLVLYQLLGFLVKEAESVVRTTFEDLAEQKQDMPVGTTLALIEQGMAVLSAIHGRLYAAMQKTLQVIHRLNRMYVTDDDIRDDTGQLLARRDDYQGPVDVIPVADPRIFSEVQRFAQMQVIAQRAESRPALYNQRKVEIMILERLKFPNPEQLLVAPPDPKEMNAVNENVAVTLGRPVTAFPEQEHLAHIQAHCDYMMSPFFGMLAPIQQRFMPAMVQHLVEHITLWYASRVYEHASAATGQNFEDLLKFKDPKTRKEIDKSLALASTVTIDEAKSVFANLPPVIAQAMQIVSKIMQSQQDMADPTAKGKIAVENVKQQGAAQLQAQKSQDKQAELATKQQDAQAKTAERMQELRLKVVDGQRESRDAMADRQQKERDRASRAETEQMRQLAENQRSREDNATKVAINTQDNQTALTIAEAEIESSEKVAVSTGTGINPGSSD